MEKQSSGQIRDMSGILDLIDMLTEPTLMTRRKAMQFLETLIAGLTSRLNVLREGRGQ